MAVSGLPVSLLAGLHLLLAQASPSVDITPSPAHPGSTLQVLTGVETVVEFGERTFQTFPLATGQWRALVPLSALERPGRYPLTFGSSAGARTQIVEVAPRAFRMQRLRLPADRADLEETPRERAAIGAALDTVSPEQFWQLPFRTPVSGRISAGYGLRRTYNGVLARNYYHRGYDIAAGSGTAVVAPAAGRVLLVGTTQQGFRVHGNTLVLDHGQGVVSIYIHLSRVLVRQGEQVQAGERVARVGSTGRASGPHLHWGVYVHGVSVDPAEWLGGRVWAERAPPPGIVSGG